MTSAEWEPIADRIAAAFPKADFAAERRAEYLAALEALPAASVATAVETLLREPRSGPPSAPVIRQAVVRPAPSAPAPALGLPIDRARIYGLSFLSSAVSALALVLLAVWWLWSRG